MRQERVDDRKFLMEKKPMLRNGKEYRTLNSEIRNKCRQAKEECIVKKCVEIERMNNIKHAQKN